MHSDDSPCSGFVAVNDAGVPCAGFRQCGSDHGTTGLNPAAHPWDVPLEVRCAENDNLTQWGDNQYLYPVRVAVSSAGPTIAKHRHTVVCVRCFRFPARRRATRSCCLFLD